MTTLDKTVLVLVVVLGFCGLAYGYSEVIMAPIKAMTVALNSAHP